MTSTGLDTYLNEIGRLPVLTEESQLLHCRRIHAWVQWPGGRDNAPERIRRIGRRSMDVMITTNLRLVVSITRRYLNRGMELEDLIQEGNIGLARGLELFDPARGYRVSTYCYWWVRQAMSRAIYMYARTIRLPINTYELLYKAHRVSAEVVSRTGHPPSTEDLATSLGVTVRRLQQVLDAWSSTECVSTDVPAGPDQPHTLVDLISSPAPESDLLPAAADLPSFLESYTNRERSAAAIARLNPTEREVIESLFFAQRTTRELSTQLETTPAKVRLISHRACQRLRAELESPTITPSP